MNLKTRCVISVLLECDAYPGGVRNKGLGAVITQKKEMLKKKVDWNDTEHWLEWISKQSKLSKDIINAFVSTLEYEPCMSIGSQEKRYIQKPPKSLP